MADRVVSSSSSVMPSTPFMGVRISWLSRARNSPLAFSSAMFAARRRLAVKWSYCIFQRRSACAWLSRKPAMAVMPSRPLVSHSLRVGT
ncbi:hypothetical protein D9M71_235570 [compost metagenome]